MQNGIFKNVILHNILHEFLCLKSQPVQIKCTSAFSTAVIPLASLTVFSKTDIPAQQYGAKCFSSESRNIC